MYMVRGVHMTDEWDIDDRELALIVVDMQNKFTIGPLSAFSKDIMVRINEVIGSFREHGRPIVFIKMDTSCHDMPEMDDPEGFIAGLDYRDEPIVHKVEMSAFCRTELADLLHDMRVDGIVVCGLVSRFCVHATYFGAYDNGITPFLLKGGSASYNPEHTAMVEGLCKTVTLDDILRNKAFMV